MRRAVELFRRDGLFPVLDGLNERFSSALIRKRYGYPSGFLMGRGTSWLTGGHALVGKNLRIGKRCRIETIDIHLHKVYTPNLIIGDNVSINDDVHIACAGCIKIGNEVLMASKIFISDHNHGKYNGENPDNPMTAPNERILSVKSIEIGDFVWIGEMVTILPGVVIGSGSIIGSNSVVTKSIPDNCIAVGIPAKIVKVFNTDSCKWESI